MLKYILFIAGNFFLLNVAVGQRPDTIIVYFKNTPRGKHQVNNLESADFIRMVLPPDPSDNRVNVKEFYKNGSPKFIGKYDPVNARTAFESLSGDCISYYPNGKKESICHYTKGQKQGNEYLFYPNGTIYCYKKNTTYYGNYSLESKFLECYDLNGTKICSDSNGQWIEYASDFKTIIANGPIKNGSMDGEWHYRPLNTDSLKYNYTYKKVCLFRALDMVKMELLILLRKKQNGLIIKVGSLFLLRYLKII